MRRSTNSSPESGASFLSLGPGPGGAADATAKDRRPRHALVLGLSATALIFSLVAIANLYYSADPYAAAVRGRGTPAPVLLPGTPLLADHVGNAYLTSRLSNCLATFIRYEPSAYEASWVENAKEWGKDEATYCPTVRGQKDKIDVWIANTSTWMNIRKTSIPDGLGPREQEIFSRFVFEESCVDPAKPHAPPHRRIVYSYIEPLATSLRDPRAFCFGELEETLRKAGDRHWYMVGRRDFLFLAAADDPAALQTHQFFTPGGRRKGQVIFMDLGASTFNDGLGGASQSFFYTKFAERGLPFDRMLNWEVTAQNPTKLLGEVPGEIFSNYQYFNIPADATPKSPKNPLEVLRRIARPEDFVVFKLDIDNMVLEGAFIEQILADDGLSSLIDEMIYEHHVSFEPMQRRHWGASANPNLTLADSFDIFLALRRKGIRMHGWI